MNIRIAAFLLCLTLSACGIKPGEVDPPGGHEGNAFPHNYPDLGTDP